MAQSVWEPPEELSTVNDYLDFWAKHLDKAMAMAGAAVGLDFTTSRLSWDDADERTLREGSGLEMCNSVITSGGLAMVVDLPASVRRDDEIEFERWGQDHDKVIILCEGGTLDAASGLALYLSSVTFEVRDVGDDPGWTEALKHNREAGGSLKLPIYMQGDRIYWGHKDEDLQMLVRIFRQNQAARFLTAPPELLAREYGAQSDGRVEADW